MNWTLLKNSLLVSALTTLLAVAFGFLVSLFLAGLNWRWRRWWIGGAVVGLGLPPFLVTGCWLHLVGLAGVWRAWLPLDIYSLGGTVWVLSLMLWPVSLLLILGAWQRLEPCQLESEPGMTGWPLIHRLLVPLARNALAQSAVLTFVLALNNFAVPAILQVKVFPVEVWLEFNDTLNLGAALAMSWPLVLAPLLLLFWLHRREIQWPRLEETVAAGVFRRQLGAGWFWAGGGFAAGAVFLSIGLPLTDLCSSGRTWQEFFPAFKAGQGAAINSAMFSMVSAVLVVGVALATWRWPVGVIVWLPFLVPGVLLGFVMIFMFNNQVLFRFYESVGIVFLAWTSRYLAVGWNTTAHALRSVDPDLSDSARLEGASRWQLLRHVHWPQVAPQLAAAAYLTYLFCLWDAETLILIMPPGAETLSVRVFNFLHYGHNPQVNALCLILLLLAVAPLALLLAVNAWRKHRTGLGGILFAASSVARSDKPTPNPSHGGELARVIIWTAPVLEVARRGSARLVPLLSVALVAIGFLTGCSPAAPLNEAPVESKFFSRVQVIGTRGAGAGEFNKPRSVAVDAQDNLYAVDMTGRVQKFATDGTFLSFWQMPQTDKGKPKGMCRDEKGNVVVLEPHYSRVNHFTPEGRLVAQWGAHGTNAGHLAFPRSVIVNSHGDVFVSEYGLAERVQQFTSAGAKWVRTLGRSGEGDGEFNRAEGLGVDAQDRLYVADSCHHRVQVFSPEGKFLTAYGRPGSGRGEMSYPYDVKVDGQGFQFVCEFGNSRIQIFDPHGQPVEILGGPGAVPGQFSNPWGVALDSKGNLYVADAMNHRVQKFIRRNPLHAQSKTVVSRQLSVVSGFRKPGGEPRVADHGPRTMDHGQFK
jgi:ABC-type Fe3+ transport system permease subunit/sugar lactone lactonase YvrE